MDVSISTSLRPLRSRNMAFGLVLLGLLLQGCSEAYKTGDPSPVPLEITASASLAPASMGAAYSATLAATGGTAPYHWSVGAGALPGGLTLSSSGLLSGTPTEFGTFRFTARIGDAAGQTATAPLQITIAPPLPKITISDLPKGEVGAVYSSRVTAAGGVTPYAWSVSAGALPGGLTLSPAGSVSGIPSSAGIFNFTAKVSDVDDQTVSSPLQITIVPAPQVTTTSPLIGGELSVAYATTLAATGGTAPFTWRVSAGAPPGSLTLSSSGVLSGKPTVLGRFSFTAEITDVVAQTASATLQITIAPAPLMITTAALPGGELGVAYATTLAARGGTAPYSWSIISGTLPAGLSLNESTGAIQGTPSQMVTGTPLTFQVTDSTGPSALTQSANLTLTVTNIGVTLSPLRGAVTVGQQLPFTATVLNDVGSAGVIWTASAGGTLSGQKSTTASFSSVTAGVYTVTATSVADNAKSASATIGVTDLTGVLTYHNDLSRDGSNPKEYALTTSNVTTATFGKLFSCTVDGAIYTQPLWVANLTINGAKHNVIFVVTQHDSLYAFDADASPCLALWHVNLIDATHGGTAGETSVPSGPTGNLVGSGNGDITPEVGVTGTPVVDPATNTLYVVSKSVIPVVPTFFQRLHAIDILTGSEKAHGPMTITATYPGTGDGSSITTFAAGPQNQRPGLALVKGIVYIAWASHEDNPPYYGWVIGYDADTLAQTAVLNVTPNVGYGGIWMGGGAPSADSNNNLYLITGNGIFDANSATAPNNDFGDSFLKLSTMSGLSVSQYFTPSNQANDNSADQDFGAGGATILVDQPSGPVAHLVIGGGKDGYLYLLNRDMMGGFGDSNAWQRFNFGNGAFATGAFWNNRFYLAGANAPLEDYSFNPGTGQFDLASASQTSIDFGFPGSTPSVSSSGIANGIVWILDNKNYCTPQSPGCGPAVLHAYDATNITTELWNSKQATRNAAGNAVKFAVPTIANGKVYVGTRGNNSGGNTSSSSIPGELDVFGLLPN